MLGLYARYLRLAIANGFDANLKCHTLHGAIRSSPLISSTTHKRGLRLIGIRNDLQRQGLGAVLLKLAEETALALGRTEVLSTPSRPR